MILFCKRVYTSVIMNHDISQELQGMPLYPLEVIPGTVYMGTAAQANDPEFIKRLGFKCLINASPEIPIV